MPSVEQLNKRDASETTAGARRQSYGDISCRTRLEEREEGCRNSGRDPGDT
nr:MAG TPA: hypothetical protein [Caudoviricetes sp.]